MDVIRPDLKKKQHKKKLTQGAILVFVLIGAVYLVLRLDPATPVIKRSDIVVGQVQFGELTRTVRATGVLVPKGTYQIAAMTSGKVNQIYVQVGSSVFVGDTLLALSNPEITQRLARSRADLRTLEAERALLVSENESDKIRAEMVLAENNAEYETMKIQLRAEREVAEAGVIPRIQYEKTQLLTDQKLAKLDAQRALVERLGEIVVAKEKAFDAKLSNVTESVTAIEAEVASLVVKADYSGAVIEIEVERGEQVESGQELFTTANLDELFAELSVPEEQAHDISVGQNVLVRVGRENVQGSVVRINPAVEKGFLKADVEFTGEISGGRPDLRIDAQIEIETRQEVYFISRPAFVHPNTAGSLYKIHTDGTAVRIPVHFGDSFGEFLEIRQGGVVGEAYVVSDISDVTNSNSIRLE